MAGANLSGPKFGLGKVRPSEVSLSPAPNRNLGDISWSGWGGADAEGSGVGAYMGPGEHNPAGDSARATIVVSKLGTCDGQLAYEEVIWYFPEYGQTASSVTPTNICTGNTGDTGG